MKNITQKIGATIVASTLAISLISTPAFAKGVTLDSTGSVVTSSVTQSTFKNKELEQILKNIVGGNLTSSNLSSITSLELPNTMTNHDLSDLAYLPNLQKLTVDGIKLDCYNLIENTKLRVLTINNSDAYNTKYLPNNIQILYLNYSNILSEDLYCPSSLTSLLITTSNIRRIRLSNPEALTYLYYKSYGLLDLYDFRNCVNLDKIMIRRSPNIAHGEVLTNFKDLSMFSLDEQATIWMNGETFENLAIPGEETKNKLVSAAKELDNLVASLNLEGLSEKEKLDKIILYVIKQIEYDKRAMEVTPEGVNLANYYNSYPISASLHSNVGICASYASLFTAIANRAGLNTYQVATKDHAWNMVKLASDDTYYAYDLTGLDASCATLRQLNTTTGSYEKLYDRERTCEYYITHGIAEQLYYYGFDYELSPDEVYHTNPNPYGIEHDIFERDAIELAPPITIDSPIIEAPKTLQKTNKKIYL